jgi:hypothetical protein
MESSCSSTNVYILQEFRNDSKKSSFLRRIEADGVSERGAEENAALKEETAGE